MKQIQAKTEISKKKKKMIKSKEISFKLGHEIILRY